MSARHIPISSPQLRQRGAALFVAMVMMLLVLVLAVVGMRTVTLESRIAGNMLESQKQQASLRSTAEAPPRKTTAVHDDETIASLKTEIKTLRGTTPLATQLLLRARLF